MIKFLEKYIPTAIFDFVGNDNVKASLSYHLSDGHLGLIVLHGITGSGKSCLANILAKDFSENAIFKFSGVNLIQEVQQLLDCLDLASKKTIIIEQADQFPPDYLELLDHYLGTDNLRLILLYKRYEDVPDYIKARFNIYGLERPEPAELVDYLNKINEEESLGIDPSVITEIVSTSKCLFPQSLSLLGECFILGINDIPTFNKAFKRDLEVYFSDLIYYLKDKNRVSKILEYLLTRYTSKDIYHLFSEYCVYFFQQGNNDCYRKLGNRLLVYSKEISRLAEKSTGVTDLYCDLYLLEAYIANNPTYKGMVDLAVILPETDREKRQSHLIKKIKQQEVEVQNTSKETKIEEKAVKYLSATDLIKKLETVVSIEEG